MSVYSWKNGGSDINATCKKTPTNIDQKNVAGDVTKMASRLVNSIEKPRKVHRESSQELIAELEVSKAKDRGKLDGKAMLTMPWASTLG
jgi:hypothetical protein